jgi:hypothetical protein
MARKRYTPETIIRKKDPKKKPEKKPKKKYKDRE